MKTLSSLLLASLAISAFAQNQASEVANPTQKFESLAQYSDQDITDSYQYILGRYLILRQQQKDFKTGGLAWNKLVHRKVADVKRPNPNLDVVYSEAWIGIDENSCTMIDVPPKIKGRYYTVQTLNGWGETTSNVNERTYPKHPFGKFAYCLPENKVTHLPEGTQRIDLPSQKSRLLLRVEIGKDMEESQKLQKMFNLTATGVAKIDQSPVIKDFTNQKLPGVEIFDKNEEILASEKDINPGMDEIQTKLKAIAEGAKNKTERKRIERIVRQEAIPSFRKEIDEIPMKNGWQRPKVVGNYGNDYHQRTVTNFIKIWSNNNQESVSFKGTKDSTGQVLSGGETYTMTFASNEIPDGMAHDFWSVTAVNNGNFQVLANPLKKYLINNQSNLQKSADGSLTIYFSPTKPVNAPLSNWLPTVKGKKYQLTFRYYGPKDTVKNEYFPPALIRSQNRIGQN